MRINPINQSPIMFRGHNNQQHSTMKRYCEPRTGIFYYYDTVEFQKEKEQNSFSHKIKNFFNKVSSFTKSVSESNHNADPEDILWL